MKNLLTTFFLSLFFSAILFAQEETGKQDIFSSLNKRNANEGTIKIHQDSSLKSILLRYITYCETAKGFPGYRIRIFSDSGNSAREKAHSMQKKFSTDYPEHECYLTYKNPNFEIHVGDFRTKSEAIKLLKAIQPDYTSAFIVKSLISFPK